jgi:hypothetical protein
MAELARDHIPAHELAVCRSGHATVTRLAYTGSQVQPMRFSSLFQPTPPVPEQAQQEPPRDPVHDGAECVHELPDELDARVRLVGEWQLGEA